MSAHDFEDRLKEAVAKHGNAILRDLRSPTSSQIFAERLLLGLINANKSTKLRSDRDRLARAQQDLFGKPLMRRADDACDDDFLQTMAQWHWLDLANGEKQRSDRKLAEGVLTLNNFSRDSNAWDANVNRLRRKFAKRKSELLRTCDERVVEVEVLRREALVQIEAVLDHLGIAFWSET